ncbi:class I SAM-dependent methyltransferase [Paenibacillus aestuarii]|uniref:Class I SAM-dependent methyltransferase n=1 Tax=Paenibacillus aestuarii TaxID=516965 RepID=A0ABW0K7D6_9BACL|nr:class I SAM-dependent methyltransferase [Paenibacillus aestuarii]
MIPEGNLQSNVDRFLGFGELYDQHRPEAPKQVIEIINTYLGTKPSRVIDIGCGTGLSTFIWADAAEQIIGIEPNPDMRAEAQKKWQQLGAPASISFLAGYSNQLPLEADSADAITCSQSFHWMEPMSTLQEIARVLRSGGVFAAYDCDWPPVLGWRLETAYNQLIDHGDAIIAQTTPAEQTANKWRKDRHLHNMTQSGLFRFTREIVFHNMELCNADRYMGLVLSQGGLQTVFKMGSTELNAEVDAFRRLVEEHFGGSTLELLFSYRLRLAVK